MQRCLQISRVGRKSFRRGLTECCVKDIQEWGRGEVESLGVDTVAGVLHVISRMDDHKAYAVTVARLAEHLAGCLKSGATYSSPQTLVCIVSALAEAEVYTPKAFAEAAKHLAAAFNCAKEGARLTPNDVAAVAQAYSTCSYSSAPLLVAIAQYLSSAEKLQSLTPDAALCLLRSLALLSHPVETNAVLLAAIHVMSDWETLTDHEVTEKACMLAWSVGVFSNNISDEQESQNAARLMGSLMCLVQGRPLGDLSLPQVSKLLLGVSSVMFTTPSQSELSQCCLFVEEVCQRVSELCNAPQPEPSHEHFVAVQSSVSSLYVISKNLLANERVEIATIRQASLDLAGVIEESLDELMEYGGSGCVSMMHCLMNTTPPGHLNTLFEKYCSRVAIETLDVSELGLLACLLPQSGTVVPAGIYESIYEASIRGDLCGGYTLTAVRQLCHSALRSGLAPPHYLATLREIVHHKHPADPTFVTTIDTYREKESHSSTVDFHQLIEMKLHRREVPIGVDRQSQLCSQPKITLKQLQGSRTKIMLQGMDGWLGNLCVRSRDCRRRDVGGKIDAYKWNKPASNSLSRKASSC